VPILLYDPRHRAVALAHGGWRGTAEAVAMRTVEAMRARYGTRPADLVAALAPAIGDCCYTVSEEVLDRFRQLPEAWESVRFVARPEDEPGNAGPGVYLDLWETNRRQLLAAGVRPEHIEVSDLCTGCRTDLFFSHRMEHGRTGRFGVAIGLAA
jgi:YfiH family protein